MPRRRPSSRRRTSRNPRRTSRRGITIRKGSISAPGFSARLYRGNEPVFRGRVEVDRGSGMVEYPSVGQLPRILREEGIPASAADRAFGRRVHANSAEEVRPGYIRRGAYEALLYTGPEPKLKGKIHLTGPNLDLFKTFAELSRINAATKHFSTAGLLEAFGDLAKTESVIEKKEVAPAKFKHATGKRRRHFRLGHIVITDDGKMAAKIGLQKGSASHPGTLALIDKRKNEVVWGIVDADGKLRNAMTSREIKGGINAVIGQAAKLGIPTHAVVTVFGYLMDRNTRSRLLAQFHKHKWTRGEKATGLGGMALDEPAPEGELLPEEMGEMGDEG